MSKCATFDGWRAVQLTELLGWECDYTRFDPPRYTHPQTGEVFEFGYVHGRGACLRPLNFQRPGRETLAGETMPEPPEERE